MLVLTSGPAVAVTNTLSVYLLLADEPAALAAAREAGRQGGRFGLSARQAGLDAASRIESRQQALRSALAGTGARETGRFRRLVNAVRVDVPADELDAMWTLPGVVDIRPVRQFERNNATSVPFVGGLNAWTSAALRVDGSGVRIGIIDSGIDYTHAMFGGAGTTNAFATNDSTVIEPGTFPTAKVAGGWDFCGDDYDSGAGTTPQPDPDPLDCSDNGHGSHVAGTAAGFGVLTNGTTYAGAYTNGVNLSSFSIGPGVAPKALLYALRLFGCDGSTTLVVDALEWASDPNGDLDFSDRLDVVNMSLGSPFGLASTNDPEIVAADRLALLGCVVATSAGNNGNTFCIGGGPGSAARAVTVANSMDDGLQVLRVQLTAPLAVTGLYDAVEASFTRPLAEAGPVTGQVVYAGPPDACGPLTNAAAITNRIALIDRGGCNFDYKVEQAWKAGARAAVVVNNVDGAPFVMGGSLDIPIPAVMISKADGDRWKTQLGSNLAARLTSTNILVRAELADQVNSGSSRGPSAPRNLLKPDISAPGTDIESTRAGGGNRGTLMSGTSMSSPHVAGAAALVRQAHTNWTAEDIKAALMNTAETPMRDAQTNGYPESRVGAGRLRVDRAVQTPVLAMAEPPDGRVTLNLGALEMTGTYSAARGIRLINRSGSAVSLSALFTTSVVENGIAVTAVTKTVTVPALGSATALVQFTANPALFDRTLDPTSPTNIAGFRPHGPFEVSGQIWFTNAATRVHVPYYSSVRAASLVRAAHTSAPLPYATNPVVILPLNGPSAHPAPLVSLFQLGWSGASSNHADAERAAADLVAAGAASDAPAAGGLTGGRLYFGLATAGPWTMPQRSLVSLEVEIDVDGDGAQDYIVFNASQGNLSKAALDSGASANDALMAGVQRVSDGLVSTGAWLNVFPPDDRDTAPVDSRVMVLSAPAAAIGLGTNRSFFRYRVKTYDSNQVGGPLRRETAWIPYDAAYPAFDTARGPSNSPFRADGGAVTATVDFAALTAFTQTCALLVLHHMNLNTARHEIVWFTNNPADVTARPGMPTNTLPGSGDLADSLTPTLAATPYRHGDAGATHAASQWQIAPDSTFGVILWSSGYSATALTNAAVPGGVLAEFGTYYWRVRYRDSKGVWGAFSTATSFQVLFPSGWTGLDLPEASARGRHTALGSDGTNLYFTLGNVTNAGFYRIAGRATNGWETLAGLPIPSTVNNDSGVGDLGYMDGSLWMLARRDNAAAARCVYRYSIFSNRWDKGGAMSADGINAACVPAATNRIYGGWIGADEVRYADNWAAGSSVSAGSMEGIVAHPWDGCRGTNKAFFIKHEYWVTNIGILASANLSGTPSLAHIYNMPFNPGMGCAVEYMPTNLFADGHDRLFILRGGQGSGGDSDGQTWTTDATADQLAIYDLRSARWSLKSLPFAVDEGSEMCRVGDTLYVLAANGVNRPLKFMAFPHTVYVATNGPARQPFASWADAAADVHVAVAQALPGGLVLLSNGTYAVTGEVSVADGVRIQGLNGAGATVVDGQNLRRCFYLRNDASLQDLTIVRGAADKGAAVYILTNGAVRRCVIKHNATTMDAGGVFCMSGGDVENCLIVSNTAGWSGGGVFLENGGTVRWSEIAHNTCNSPWGYGGGIYSYSGTIENSLIHHNSSTVTNGGGIHASGASRIRNCTIVENSAPRAGGGASLAGTAYALNSIIYFNHAPADSNYTVAMSTRLTNCCTAPAPAANGNIGADPRLLSDFRLATNSPCIDAGTNQSWMSTDFDGRPRIIHDRADLGAFEAILPGWDSDSDGIPDEYEWSSTRTLTDLAPGADYDADRFDDLSEYLAGTLAGDSASYLGIDTARRGGAGTVIQWPSVDGQSYRLERATNLVRGFDATLKTNIPGIAPMNTETDATAAGNGRVFYRVELE